MLTKHLNGVEIGYDMSGYASGPPVVLLTGWAHDMRLYDQMLPLLVPKHRVIRVNYRGHGPSHDPIPDFGVEEQVADILALLESLHVQQFYLVSHSHGGWPALELADRLGKQRVLCLLMIDQIMTSPPPAFASGLQAMQAKDTWLEARQGLFENWLSGSTNAAVLDHFYYSMGSFGFEMWSLSCRVIADAYGKHGSPMDRMSKLGEPPAIRHVFAHPRNDAQYEQLHVDFAAKHHFFSYTHLSGETHFPDIEIPEVVVAELESLIHESGGKGGKVNGVSNS
ncbi:1H-3-hydroxy-4-oxoquinaldine 2,4-dioxygenase [Cyphellophora attinorum]|uniref:1H-3-hydroxy-4-oxoquinaldine 2,4-dioxygenase n=1 Tax=Cyphellophora attinorum TaxID=1664694 RepID=A0A0N0NR44_9EURO|nr:1H-3-hydroxy-4-oxoquinaldine 2,4-dioxygenase [Phialophora attinorum]KPI44658.1 1H-3-hydroxy-4-oxoquinaldine 2,4-dioxygenase [Phialophora attinorum]